MMGTPRLLAECKAMPVRCWGRERGLAMEEAMEPS